MMKRDDGRESVMIYGTRCVCLQCGTCGVTFAMPEVVYETQIEEGGFHTCPNGHHRGWREGRKEREAEHREYVRLKQAVAQKDDEIAELKVKAAAAAGESAKLKKRAAAGVCPCCHRTVRQMAAHMKSKHPEFVAAPALKLVAK